jgi:hypothetical protein
MNLRSRLTFTLTLALTPITAALLLPACAVDASPNAEGAVASTDEAMASQFPVPQGLVCGLSHTGFPTTACEGLVNEPGVSGQVPFGYTSVFTGDLGMPSGQGFAHDSVQITSASIARLASDQLPLPRGVVCGLKHTVNAPNERCMGYDAQTMCPAGWLHRTAEDLDSCGTIASGTRCAYWHWCEYQDPNAKCANPASCAHNVPLGTVCGLAHTRSNKWHVGPTIGFCDGAQLGGDVGITDECNRADGWFGVGPRDEGGESGSGLTWCQKLH